VARQAAMEGMNLISGGARGVDELAMLASLEAEGNVVGVLANDLFRSALAGKWRKHLKNRQLALVTPFFPEGRFQVGNAMGRNKYIYCLSDFALVVRSEKGKGGTWAGAVENQKRHWTPLFVASPSNAEGNVALASMGATFLSVAEEAAGEWLQDKLRGVTETCEPESAGTPQVAVEVRDCPDKTASHSVNAAEPSQEARTAVPTLQNGESIDSMELIDNVEPKATFDEFMRYISEQIIENGEVKFSDVKEQRKDITKKQIREWLDRAVDAGLLKRKGRLLSYTSNAPDMNQHGFNFE
jgi:predicted Rossmann fold nucleotide-binding protein DprA/Smf involved in DNA uptake